MVALIPLMVWTARKPPSPTCREPGSASSVSSRWLIAETCSRDSERKSSPYCESSIRVERVRECGRARVRVGSGEGGGPGGERARGGGLEGTRGHPPRAKAPTHQRTHALAHLFS